MANDKDWSFDRREDADLFGRDIHADAGVRLAQDVSEQLRSGMVSDIEVDLSEFETRDTERPPAPPGNPPAPEDFGAETCCTTPAPAGIPSDSAARKRIPLCTGVYDYFPDALYTIVDPVDSEMPDRLPDDDLVSGFLSYLAIRGQESTASTIVSWFALCILQKELTGSHPARRPLTESALFDSFSEALAAVAEVSWYGNEKHNPGEPLHHARGKSADHPDCALRHLAERGGFDGPLRHSACLVWRALAMAQLECERHGAPLARGARNPVGTP